MKLNSVPKPHLNKLISFGVVFFSCAVGITELTASTAFAQDASSAQKSTTTAVTPHSSASVTPHTFTAVREIRLIVKRNQHRVYVYQGEQLLTSYRIAVGKKGWETPLGTFHVFNMETNPTFKSFKTGKIIPPGADNPLGLRWIGIWTDGKTQLGFHGTDQEELVGKAVSHGCMRMYNKDVVALYEFVKIGTLVTVEP
jgi:L,D-transpeptidase ErfK/SrfK